MSMRALYFVLTLARVYLFPQICYLCITHMDAHDIFKILAKGCKFDVKRFRRDAELFGLVKPSKHDIKIKEENIPEEEEASEPLVVENNRKRKCEERDDNTNNGIIMFDGESTSKNESVPAKKQKKTKTADKIMKLEQEKINHLRNLNRISVTGTHVPKLILEFDELRINYQVSENLLNNMKTCGYMYPTPIQKQAIPVMLENRQILACAPTGSGKTAAFLLPIIHSLQGPQKKGFRAVILNPTRELAKQTYREALRLSHGYDFRIHIINKINQAKYGPSSSQQFDILITTPKRLVFLLNQDPPAISLNNVEWLIVDEADKLFEEGIRGFRKQLEEISRACTNPYLRRGMFSATNTPAVSKWCRTNMKRLVTVTVGHRNAAADTVEQKLVFVGWESGKLLELRNIIQKGITPPVLIFVQSKERGQKLFKELIYDGIYVDVIHSDRTMTERDNIVRGFREGKIWVLICTELMGRGIDFKGVNLVINYDFPPSAISYIHRIGRTGRAGHKGKAITFFTIEDKENLRSIAAIMRESGCEVPEYILAMKKRSKKKQFKDQIMASPRKKAPTAPSAQQRKQKKQSKKSKETDMQVND
ncbi:probable ATP-dependent RNA helicase DDX52 [Pseudomyrmex gracilis]|uniref:probable ATP-dependent RNA helicase DDX52 n=1 Tax=Pseudomyrmex gracilis TaxID=219809 RepID=UPI00099590FE|nr:probable ATP-dependent RNA helicase DDX52 [Pseudomyrmex gracilis]